MPIIGGNTAGATPSPAGTDLVKVPNTTFQYSMTRIADLEAPEYTQVAIVSDASPSVEEFKQEMENMLGTIIDSCKLSARADNLLIRHTIFHTSVRENHGWMLLNNIKPDDYKNCLRIGGGTALFDAALEALEVMCDSAKSLTKNKFTVNGLTVYITDGEDNSSFTSPVKIAERFAQSRQAEEMESHVSILVGVGCGDQKNGPQTQRERDLHDYLKRFQQEAGITHFIPIKDASKSTLARLAAFISKSISDQSQALGTGGPSQNLTTSQSLNI